MKLRTVEYCGKVYRVYKRAGEIPDFSTMEKLHVSLWLLKNTVPRGYSKKINPLAGLAGVIGVIGPRKGIESDTIEVFEDQEPEPCRTCAGTGIGQYGDPNTSNCRDCKGTGEEQDPEPSDWGG